VIPVASAIRRSGASRGATAGFLISTPETGVDSISITYALLGPVMAVLRPLAALLSAITAGVLINRLVPESAGTIVKTSSDDVPDSPARMEDTFACTCDSGAPIIRSEEANSSLTYSSRMTTALRYGFFEMFADLAVWLIIGFVLAGLISAMLPEQFLEGTVGEGLPVMLAVLALALPLYACATSSTPVIAALIAKGLSPGTALVFLLVGPATNIATMVVVGKELGRRSLCIYLASIAIVALLLGLLVDMALVIPALAAMRVGVEIDETRSWWSVGAATALVLLLLNGLRMRYLPRRACRSG
jgi:uncharacterized protein